ncbi:MAG TPA: hypothetical protein VM029_01185 [Opitutaceae bacterium]|nr:hypothetical protein [Opitutaceae bacterium]
MHQTKINVANIPGWGVDADTENDPTYPMKQRNNGEHAGYSWDRPPQQPPTVQVLHSNERPNLSATFGTSTPPRGLSGMLRRFAFRYSESNYGHWLPLMAADRIGVFEGIAGDLMHGRVPNFFAERGGKAEWRFNRTSIIWRTILRVLLWVGVIVALVAWIR